MFDPVRMHTTFFPLISFLILYSPATARAPDGSQMYPIEYSRITVSASLFSVTETNPSTHVLPILKQIYPTFLTDEPLQNLLTLSDTTIYPFMIELENGMQTSGSTAIILVFGLTCFIKLAIALANAPPPDGTTR